MLTTDVRMASINGQQYIKVSKRLFNEFNNEKQYIRTIYRIESELGAGKYGKAHLAVNINNPNDKIVLKEMYIANPGKDQKISDPNDIEREYQIATKAGLSVGRVVEFGDRRFLPLKFLDGIEADKFFKDPSIDGKLKAAVALKIVEKTTALHKLGINHNDLHLGNIIIVKNEPYIVDYGRARKVSDGKSTASAELGPKNVQLLSFTANVHDGHNLYRWLKPYLPHNSPALYYLQRVSDIYLRELLDYQLKDLQPNIGKSIQNTKDTTFAKVRNAFKRFYVK